MPRPPGHGPGYEVKRQEIIDTAAALFAKKGYAATGIVELGDTVGLAKGALYYYIGSKENLLVEIQERVLDPLLVAAARIQESEAAPLVKLRLLSGELLQMIFTRLDHIWVYEHDYRQLTGKNRTRMLQRRQEFEGVVRSLLTAAMDEGAIGETDPTLATLQFLNMHNHTYQWVKLGQDWDAEFLSKTYCATLFNGFAQGACDLAALEADVAAYRSTHAA
ncbi:TetR/AcrR family transcriptional regulator [Nocardia jiangxiensis]|uniref:TetR family transcriptional regulator n=1 Tax=Nocardia jiangxiensis TaxID=282685 RepID=A0ABW6RWH1_9NOCA|nr:TetR/AcrR family transcriptional regulator [Nocardia jiangxiensis]